MQIQWNDRFLGGIDEIDEQHKDLIVTYNQLVDACLDSTGPLRPAVVMNLLTGKIKTHSKAEENLLAAHGYPHAAKHSSDHQDFVKRTEDLEYRFLTGGNPDMKLGAVRQLGQELVEHTISDDIHGVEFLKSKIGS